MKRNATPWAWLRSALGSLALVLPLSTIAGFYIDPNDPSEGSSDPNTEYRVVVVPEIREANISLFPYCGGTVSTGDTEVGEVIWVKVLVRNRNDNPVPDGTIINLTINEEFRLGSIYDLTDLDDDPETLLFQTLNQETTGGEATFYVQILPSVFFSELEISQDNNPSGAFEIQASVAAASNENRSFSGYADINVNLELEDEEAELGASEARAVTLTGPYVDAVVAGLPSADLATGEFATNGAYQRLISALVTDENGNPVIGECVDFFVVDSPLIGFPEEGAGRFFVAGSDGDPVEDWIDFYQNSNDFVAQGVRAFDKLLLDGDINVDPDTGAIVDNSHHRGVRTVKQVIDSNILRIVEDGTGQHAAFNVSLGPNEGNNGFSVPFIVGRAENANIQSPRLTEDRTCATADDGTVSCLGSPGTVSTLLTYPVNRIGQAAAIAACVRERNEHDQKICGVLNSCDANGENCDGAFLPVSDGTNIVLTASTLEVQGNGSQSVQLCLRDSIQTPLQGTPITYEIQNAGGATVTVESLDTFVEELSETTGLIYTGDDGCVTALISSEGFIPDQTGTIGVRFIADGVDPEAAPLVTIVPPGAPIYVVTTADNESFSVCLINDAGLPFTDILVDAVLTYDATQLTEPSVVADPEDRKTRNEEDTEDEALLGCIDYTITTSESPQCADDESPTGAALQSDLTIKFTDPFGGESSEYTQVYTVKACEAKEEDNTGEEGDPGDGPGNDT